MQKRVHLERVKAKPWAVEAAFTEERGLAQFHGDCERPFELYVRGLPDKLLCSLGMESETPVVMSLLGRCRRCAPCLAHRSRLWAARACTELLMAPRTWFGTLTLSPDRQFQYLAMARSAAAKTAVDWDALSEDERFQRVDRQVARELRAWLDRVRKRSGPIRYLLVCEAHKSGLPHYHCLVHETKATVTHRDLTEPWRLGFSKFKLVPHGEPEAVFYVAKYLAKSALCRIRNSARYGTGGVRPVSDGVGTTSQPAPRLQREEFPLEALAPPPSLGEK